MRAITLSQLLPCAGEELWDVGAGSGSVAIEWCRLTGGTAHCFEAKVARHCDIVDNAERLGVTGLALHGEAPTSFAEVTTTPAAIFIGGGVTTPGMVTACWERLMPGGTSGRYCRDDGVSSGSGGRLCSLWWLPDRVLGSNL